MRTDLVEAAMPDGLRLAGALYEAQPDASIDRLALDVVLALHGTGSNFYSSSLWAALVPVVTDWDVSVLAVNTRGHDNVSMARGDLSRRFQGSAYELVDECRLDVAGWLEFLARNGYRRIALLGHSLGAVKALYSQALEPHPSVVAIMALSPPRLSHSYFAASPRGPGFLDELRRAEELVAQGAGETLMEVRFPIPYLVTAAGYVDKYGPAERYNLLNYAGRVGCPMLVTYGSVELGQGIAFRDMPAAIEALPGSPARVEVIAGADHLYRGCEAELAQRLWRFAAGV